MMRIFNQIGAGQVLKMSYTIFKKNCLKMFF